MNKTLTSQITSLIEQTFNVGGKDLSRNIVVFPCGDVGIQVINILKNIYSIEPKYIIDNNKCRFNPNIHDSTFLKELDSENHILILASVNYEIYLSLRKTAFDNFVSENILELECMLEDMRNNPLTFFRTRIGRHSYGPICKDHDLIESIGAFSSFAPGVDVVPNHEMNFISTHPIFYAGACYEGICVDYDFYKSASWYLDGVRPKPVVSKKKRIVIGNDVWLGENVIITNYSNIGNGVIAAAGAVITKDVPDYAIVAGVPAKIIRYRYTPEQIISLNGIAWWDWSDDVIRECYNDFYLPVEEFINKYECVK